MSRISVFLLAAAVLAVSPLQSASSASVDPQIKVSFVHLAQGVPGALYEPVTPGPKSQVGVFVMHSGGDYLTHSACTELSKRGYRVLCANNSTSKSGQFNDGVLDKVMLEAKAAVIYLRQVPGVRKVVLFGHSGGATVMTAYQAIAEGGARFCQDTRKIHQCPDSLAAMPAADGVVLGDANWGLGIITLLGMDPAAGDSGMKLDPDLDMFNPKNGFKPEGADYSQAFIKRFLVAEAKRNNALLQRAQERLAAIEAGQGIYADDEPFIIPGASFTANKLFAQDVRLQSHTRKAWPLIHADGSVTTEVVHTVRVPDMTKSPSPSYVAGALKTTVRGYLSSYAIRALNDFGYDEDTLRGVDWTSSYASNPGNAENITVPFLALGMTGSFEFMSAETIYEHTKSADKTLAFVEGATHGYGTCKRCEKTPGQFGDTVKTIYDYVDGWIGKSGRFY